MASTEGVEGAFLERGLMRTAKINDSEVTQDRLREYLRYDPETGEMWLLKSHSPRFKGKLPYKLEAVNAHGYVSFNLFGKNRTLHKLAVIYMTGRYPLPSERVDHKDRNTLNNRWNNLRVIPAGENVRNQSVTKESTQSGYTGVYKTKTGRFKAHIRIDGKLIWLGTHKTLEEAIEARKAGLAKHLSNQEKSK